MIGAENFLQTSDGAHIYYEDRGAGPALIMMPGFLCTSAFFRKNAEVLSKNLRVITLDPRGQGYSSKTTSGNTIKRHASDIGELIRHLQLKNATLLGWSLASSVAVSYAAEDGQGLAGVALVDGSLYPFSDEEWNQHRAKAFNLERWLETYMPLYYDRDYFFDLFTARIAGKHGMDENTKEWIRSECMKTMPWSALELHYDFCHTNNVKNLSRIKVPVALFGADSKAYGLGMLYRYQQEVRTDCEVYPFYESGHMLFMEEAEKFNECITDFVYKVNHLPAQG